MYMQASEVFEEGASNSNGRPSSDHTGLFLQACVALLASVQIPSVPFVSYHGWTARRLLCFGTGLCFRGKFV